MNIQISGRNIILNEIRKSDLPVLLAWRNEDDFIMNCLPAYSSIVDEDRLDRELTKTHQFDRYVQFIIIKNNISVGTAWIYRYSEANKVAYLTIYIDKKYRNSYSSIEAFVLLINYIFQKLNCRKAYQEIHSNNIFSTSIYKKVPAICEGRLVNHKKVSKTEFCDLLIYALYPNVFYEIPIVHKMLNGVT